MQFAIRCHRRIMKRTIDIAGALIALLFLSPLMVTIALLLWLRHGRPVLFCQLRPGLHGKPFRLYKFRTMTDARDIDGKLLSDSDRLTKLGALLRKRSLDELPELLNVLIGNMSLVGPRPLLMEYLPYYTERERKRHSVRPGITGLAQVSGRNLLNWDDRLELDVQYIERWSLFLDLRILLKTCITVMRSSGVVIVPGAIQEPLYCHRTVNNK